MDYQEAFEFALKVSKDAGAFIKESYYQEKAIHFKDTVDLVTDTVCISCMRKLTGRIKRLKKLLSTAFARSILSTSSWARNLCRWDTLRRL